MTDAVAVGVMEGVIVQLLTLLISPFLTVLRISLSEIRPRSSLQGPSSATPTRDHEQEVPETEG
jgi:hypothetical protein